MSDAAEPGLDAPRFSWRGMIHGLRVMFVGGNAAPAGDESLSFLHTSRVVSRGVGIVILFVAGFLGWAAFAPLDSALMASGVVIVESHRKDIQHLEDGIVKEILVHDGQLVKAGQVLVTLDDTQARTELELLVDQEDSLTAQEARLVAERDGSAVIHFPPDLLTRGNDPKVAEAILGEQTTFESRKDSLNQQIGILTARKAENARVVAGLKDEQAALETQIALIQKETDSVQQMVAKGLEPVPKLLALQRNTADLSGQRGQLIEKISQVDLNSGEDALQIVNLRSQQLDDVLKDLRDVQSKRFDLLDRIQAARDVLNRTTMVAPVAGKVVNLALHTKGAVIRPGDTVMEIVPVHDQLEVEAHLRPEDADDVYVGMGAKVNLSAYKQRRLPMITGTVTNVSADRITDPRTGQSYFVATVSVDRTALKDFPDARLIPGMPVEVALDTGSRTALEYLFEPIRDVMRKGMRER
ncbi:MAG: HlyD family type I secretion periplasmic adaptor subunit [Rhizomicrobium sp.]|jgi:HlyD family type I secretion membrane fusion protein